MVDVKVVFDMLAYSGVIALLSLGITLAYITTRVFNFAHPRIANVGAYAAAASMALYVDLVRDGGIGRFKASLGPLEVTGLVAPDVLAVGIVFAVIAGIITALAEYYLVLRPLIERGADFLKLMIATLAFDFFVIATLFILGTHISVKELVSGVFGRETTSLSLHAFDARIDLAVLSYKLRGIMLFSFLGSLAIALMLYILLFKTKLGVKMRASIENPSLAEVLGINVQQVYTIAWIISGATAGFAGFLILFMGDIVKPVTATSPADEIIVSAFAGSIVGGVNSVFGSIGGGFIIGAVEILISSVITDVTGIDVTRYNKMLSMLAVALTLLFAPQGLAALYSEKIQARLPRLRGG
ncbi:branched-chain amino acid ABC transporter, permease protein [Aeropyrum pernix]|uniref:Branched-chain amino acid ABC transporter, permease protein n=1 Tax=Aeropyrum pernix TaxID=56636 RepID=A0A401H9D0_AERPX|nr:branched-chain amino acid ABC transporter permease [Aeropyrum pernix]GBF08990.1 branched-chain amino acid ABC transporter, permease protein [Aeropyrum pernix]